MEYRCLLEGYDDEWTHWSADHSKPYTKLNQEPTPSKSRPGSEEAGNKLKKLFGGSRPTLVFVQNCILVLFFRCRHFVGDFDPQAVPANLNWKAQIRKPIRKNKPGKPSPGEQAKGSTCRDAKWKLAAEISFKTRSWLLPPYTLCKRGGLTYHQTSSRSDTRKSPDGPGCEKEIQGLINLMNFDNKIDEDWEQFSHHFDQVHVNFIESHVEIPQITANDENYALPAPQSKHQRDCQMMNISVRGVEASRYRLRKNWDFPTKKIWLNLWCVFNRVSGIRRRLTAVRRPLSGNGLRLSVDRCPATAYRCPSTAVCRPLTAVRQRLTADRRPFTAVVRPSP